MLPILFQSKHFILYSYPLLMGLAWGVGYQYFFHSIKSNHLLRAQILFWGIFLSAWIGAKSLFIITSGDSFSRDFLASSNFWMGGGFVFYGGLIGGVLYLMFFHLLVGLKEEWIKAGVISLAWGHGLGRIGCFLAGCCYGDVTTGWWGIHLHGHHRHPTQLLEAFALMALALVLKRFNHHFIILGGYALGYGSVRFGLEFLRADVLRGQWALGLTPSQWISFGLVISGIYLLGKRPIFSLK